MKQLKLGSAFVILGLLGLLLSACGAEPSEPNERFQPYPEESQILGLANAFRSQPQICGAQQFPAAPAMTWVESVGDTAWYHSIEMGARDSENHIGASTTDRLRARGFDPGQTTEYRKKTALPANPSDPFDLWKADAAACADLMSPDYTVLGAGLWGKYEGGTAAYWTMILTTPQGATAQPSLSIDPSTATATVGGPALTFTATLTHSAEAISFNLTGPGSLTSVGAAATYTPPATGDGGTATVTATAGTLTASATVTLNPGAPVPSLSVTPPTATVTVGDAALQFTATLTGSTDPLSWSMTGPGSFAWQGATFTYTPPATGAGGTAVITATAGALTATATVTINPAAPTPTLTVTPVNAAVTVGGAATTFTATLTDSAETINWTLTGPGTLSSTTGAATDYTPPTTGAAGTATLTATAGTLTASAAITINAPEPSYQEAFLALINAFRSQPQVCKNGAADQAMPAVPAVTLNGPLNTAAQLHSQDMADNNYFSHTGLNGSTFSDRALAQGYTGFPAGENIAAGSPDAQGTFNQWRNSSSGHCQNMMSATIDEIGIGYGQNAASDFTHYWTFIGGKKQ